MWELLIRGKHKGNATDVQVTPSVVPGVVDVTFFSSVPVFGIATMKLHNEKTGEVFDLAVKEITNNRVHGQAKTS